MSALTNPGEHDSDPSTTLNMSTPDQTVCDSSAAEASPALERSKDDRARGVPQAEKEVNSVREQLPQTLALWRLPAHGDGQRYATVMEAVWKPLYPFFRQHGYTFWKQDRGVILMPDEDDVENIMKYSSGFAYATQHRGIGPEVGSINNIFGFESLNPLCRAARRRNGQDVVVRVLAIGDSGREHVDILKLISMGPYAFYNDNHAIPVWDFVEFEGITFGVFPKVGFRMLEAYGYWAKNSVGDVVDMILQCLEALAFIHSLGIAHRDAFKDNFLIQWHPESLKAEHIPRSRPRVFLTDFEVAVQFSGETPTEECVLAGYPMGGSYPSDIKKYARAVPPEVTSGEPYNAFMLDVWQFGKSLEDFKSTIPKIDQILETLRLPDASARLPSFYAMECLSRVVADLSPNALMIPPETDGPAN
ncbi:hypothetical protein BV20DRAFT_1048669 [Pilatotrama ljubarskyi]|nr:hypothetical protein BV20DRAFT_1048669 [Pilatotrama ljubarskyi]